MDPVNEVLVELHRLQVLAFIQRRGSRLVRLSTTSDLAQWLRIGVHDSLELVEELIDDGLVDPLPAGTSRSAVPLSLSPVGRGYLAWAEGLGPQRQNAPRE